MALQTRRVTPGGASLGGAASYPDAFGNYPPSVRNDTAQQKIQSVTNVQPEAKQKVGVRAQVQPMKFPLEQQDRFKGHISFQAIQTIPPELSISQKLLSGLISKDEAEKTYRESEAKRNRPPHERQTGNTQPSQSDSVEVQPMKIKILDGEKVTMFIPLSFVVNDIISYENAEFGAMGGAALQALQNTGDIASAAGQAIKTGVAGLKDMFAAGSSLSGIAARVAVARGAAFIPNQTARDVLRSAAQVTVNPNTRAMFRGVALREFTFQFKLIPNSSEEAREIKKIIKFFRYHAYPEGIDVKGVPIAFVFPNMFKIKLQYNNNPIGTRIKMCYLRNVSTTYNPTASSFHSDGSPTEIDLSLTFVENKTLTRQDIENVGGETTTRDFGNDPTDANYLDEGSGF